MNSLGNYNHLMEACAKAQIRDFIKYNKYKYIEKDEATYSWDTICSGNSVIAVLSNDMNSICLFDYFYPKLQKRNIKVEAVVQATGAYVEREVRGFAVQSLQWIEKCNKSDCAFVVFDIDHYNKLRALLAEYNILNVYNFYILEEQNIGKIKKIYWKNRHVRRYFSDSVSYRLNELRKESSKGTWKDFVKDSRKKHLFVFGGGRIFLQFLNCYYRHFDIEAIIDNSKSAWGNFINGIKVCSPDILLNYAPDEVVILVTPMAHETILKQLYEMGYSRCYVFRLIEAKKIKYILRKPFYYFRKHKEEILWRLYGLLPIDNKKIVFIRHSGMGFGCHEKYITLKMLEKNTNYKIVWLLNDCYEKLPDGIAIRKNTLTNRLYQLATAKIWFDDGLKPPKTIKRRNQYFICTHHGTGISLKKFGAEEKIVSESSKEMFKVNNLITDVCLAASENMKEIYRKAFLYEGEVAITGSPRIDVLLTPNVALLKTIREKLGLREHEKLVLFAPTFRRNDNPLDRDKLYSFDITSLCHALSEKFGGDWLMAVRFHTLEKGYRRLSAEEMRKFNIMDLTSYPDVQELLLVADVLITDYSSIMFDMGYADKKVFLFVPDLDDYLETERGLYFDFNELPFPICRTANDLENAIKEFDDIKYRSDVKCFNERCNVLEDGHASERVVELVEEYLSK